MGDAGEPTSCPGSGFAFAVADGAGDEDAGSGGSGASHAPSMPLRMHIALMRLVSCTHYLPEHWRSPARLTSLAGACSGLQRAELCDHFRRVRRELLRDFSLQRIQALAEELLGVLLSPILLMFFLPDVARNIIGALGSLQHSSPNLGDWCLYGCLDSAIVAENSGGAASSAEGCQSVQLLNRYGDTNEKLEKSVLSFCLNHQLVWPSSTDRINSETFQAPSHPPRAHQARNLGRQMMPTSTASRAARPLWPGHGHQDIQLEELNSLSTSQTSPPDLEGDDENGALSPQSQAVADTEPLIDLDSHQDSANDVPAQRGTTSPVACKEQVLTHIIGVPPSAINLLNDIQDFHEKETSEDPLSGEKVALLPPDLVKLPPLAPGPTALAATAVGRIGDEPEWSNTCGPWFYWLEALRAFKARRFDESSSGCGMFNRQPHGVQSHSRTERLAALA